MTRLLAGTLCSGFGLARPLPRLGIGYELAPAEAAATLVANLSKYGVFKVEIESCCFRYQCRHCAIVVGPYGEWYGQLIPLRGCQTES